MVFKKSFTLLVATGTTPFFAVVSIISDNHCRQHLSDPDSPPFASTVPPLVLKH